MTLPHTVMLRVGSVSLKMAYAWQVSPSCWLVAKSNKVMFIFCPGLALIIQGQSADPSPVSSVSTLGKSPVWAVRTWGWFALHRLPSVDMTEKIEATK